MSKEQEEKIDKEELNTQNTSEETTDTAAEAQADAAAEEGTDEGTEGDNAQKSAEESLDDKINKLTEDLEKANKEYLFLLAEFDNFRKRTVREKADIIRNAGEKVLGQLLPIIDDFERAIQAQPKVLSPLSKNFEKTLKSIGLQKIDSAIGTEFNPDLHEAISVDGDGDKETIAETLRAGYYYGDEVLRTAMVRVSKS